MAASSAAGHLVIKQPWLLMISGILLVVVIGFVIDRALFLMSAERTRGTVTSLSASNGTCGSRKQRRPCTEYQADVSFQTRDGHPGEINVAAGSSSYHDQPISQARYQRGDTVPVVYSPKNPAKAYQDSLWGVWGAPLIAFIGQVATLFGSMSEGKKRRSW